MPTYGNFSGRSWDGYRAYESLPLMLFCYCYIGNLFLCYDRTAYETYTMNPTLAMRIY